MKRLVETLEDLMLLEQMDDLEDESSEAYGVTYNANEAVARREGARTRSPSLGARPGVIRGLHRPAPSRRAGLALAALLISMGSDVHFDGVRPSLCLRQR